MNLKFGVKNENFLFCLIQFASSFEKHPQKKNEIYHHHSHILAKFKVYIYLCDDEGGRDEMCMKILCFAQVERQCSRS